MKLAKIGEIFKSIQGEGIWQKKVQVFVRFFGCNLNCKFCDTKQNSYELMRVDQVIKNIDSLGSFHSLSLTGGEPLLQVDFIKDLAAILKRSGKIIYLETNGVLYKSLAKIIDSVDLISMDFKFPSSTGQLPFWDMHQKFIKIAKKTNLFAKAVIGKSTTMADLDKTVEIIKKNKPDLLLILQPENPDEHLLEKKLSDFKKKCINNSISVKIMSQLHRKIGIK
ncbi:MAG: 7-carboxy-7-deazaguanine synthase QueE [Candidatus Omnitrophica bacterium]|nr:7-carboxy-7-deazaguanine synthase QueE [Candidatus Omnitrophota bacterium]MCF7895332.1 7-carboxy-7-deazaguanine synthase QueE [Candidatus Omnitrophota bacterium]